MDLGDFRDKAAIVGVGYTEKQGTVPGRSALSFAQEAAKAAIEDAGLKKEEIKERRYRWPAYSADNRATVIFGCLKTGIKQSQAISQ